MIKIKDLTVKNFMSVGNQTQAVNFCREQMTLVLGENLDQGGDDSGSRNGTGKTTIINALSFALFGQALTNIKKDNLINKINVKNMLVTLTFEKDGQEYRIERGRKPNILRFFVNDQEQANEETDDAQGDMRETQKDLDDILGMSHDMFKHVVALNTYTEPFLSMKAAEQRAIIEQLLGITLLSEKAEALKELIRITKDEITQETANIEAAKKANEKIQQSIEALERRRGMWQDKKEEDLSKFLNQWNELNQLDIVAELQAHKDLTTYNQKRKSIDDLNKLIARCVADEAKETKQIEKLKKEIAELENHKCYACGQDMHDEKHEQVLAEKQRALKEAALQAIATNGQWIENTDALTALGELGEQPTVFYSREEEAINHRNTIQNLEQQITSRESEQDPYQEQIDELNETALQEINWDKVNDLNNFKEHQEFLLKLLTSKDSFIRKKIIDQNLAYLNNRLTYYLDKMGLPHSVTFLNDLTVEITQLGQDLDFDNLSRGERNRLILGLSWSFRDVWESLYQNINLLFIDELIDNGLDASGVESALAVLKKMARERNKNIYLISHKDELIGRVNNVLKVIKENGFTSYDNDIEVIDGQ
jgi:DNA repair exonuclease SbcCD ATPase subunit